MHVSAEFEVLAYGISSTVYKKLNEDVVVKHSSFSVEPHDIRKELAILRRMPHPNVIPLLNPDEEASFGEDTIWMPYIPLSLEAFVESPFFSPYPSPTPTAKASLGPRGFTALTESLLVQLLSALTHLHKAGIGHRDIKPSNVLLTPQGWVRLIDFGVSYLPPTQEEDEFLYPESPSGMYFEVCTGPYRPPELLFSPRTYDATKVDMWSFGCLLAGFFTTLRFLPDDDDEEGEVGEEERDKPFVMSPSFSDDGKWTRDTLFNASRGEIGLAWSIFRIRGTPTLDTWPKFSSLPSASSVQFITVPKIPLEPILPNLPPEISGKRFLSLIEGCLAYPPEQRFSAREALEVVLQEPVVLPSGYPAGDMPIEGVREGGEEELERLVKVALGGGA